MNLNEMIYGSEKAKKVICTVTSFVDDLDKISPDWDKLYILEFMDIILGDENKRTYLEMRHFFNSEGDEINFSDLFSSLEEFKKELNSNVEQITLEDEDDLDISDLIEFEVEKTEDNLIKNPLYIVAVKLKFIFGQSKIDILTLMKSNEWFSLAELALKRGQQRSVVRKTIGKLVDDGLIKLDGRSKESRYKLTKAGIIFLNDCEIEFEGTYKQCAKRMRELAISKN